VNYWIHPEAAEELNDAALYYAENASKEIARAFVAEFERVKNLVIWNQNMGREFLQGVRILYFHRFPYGLVYCTDNTGPQIYAICHHRREPGYWKDRT
jgi:toxin ParE1/3/4